MAEQWISVREAATLAGFTEEYIRRLARDGKIKSKKVVVVVLIERRSLEAYLRDKGKLN